MTLQLEPGPTRTETVVTKIDRKRTGFNGSIFVTVDYDPKTLAIHGVRVMEKGKDGSTLDGLLHAIGDEATASIRQIQALTREGA